jgi:predicted nucleotide-binding protein
MESSASYMSNELKRNPRQVFIVHGRNLRVRDAIFQILRAMGLEPVEWEHAVALTGTNAPYIQQVLDAAFAAAQAVVVLLSGDDEARLRREFVNESDSASEITLTPQARPNVLFEAGMALGRHPDRTILLQIGDLRPFSDIGGRHVINFRGTAENRAALRARLRSAGCAITEYGSDWLTVAADEFANDRSRTQHGKPVLDLVLDNPKVLE